MTKLFNESKDEGWAKPVGSGMLHYFVKRHSLCGVWGLFGIPFQDDLSCQRCTACEESKRGRTEPKPKPE